MDNTTSNAQLGLFQAAENILLKKSQDYNSQAIAAGTFNLDSPREHYFVDIDGQRDYSYYQMLYTKMLRLKSLMDKKMNGEEANFEGLEDTLIDLANYSAFYYAYLKETND